MNFISTAVFAACVFLLTNSVQAQGLITCDSGHRSTWKTEEQLVEKVTSEGWQFARMREDLGCYHVFGISPEGERVEAYFDPVTLEKLMVVRRGEIIFRKEK